MLKRNALRGHTAGEALSPVDRGTTRYDRFIRCGLDPHSLPRPASIRPALDEMAGRTASPSDPLSRYSAKRNFARTSEPRGVRARKANALAFVIQKHWASRLHYDFRLELDGVLLSWAVPKGPSFDPQEKRMAIHVEDHPVSYGTFEGTIPLRQYGAGTVIVWDRGTWEPVGDPREGLAKGKLLFNLHGEKLAGLWELVRIPKPGDKQEPWFSLQEARRLGAAAGRVRRDRRLARQRG